MWDLVTAAHAICKGKTRPIDIVSMLQPPATRFYSFLSLNFGLVSNLDIGTEHLRFVQGLCCCFLLVTPANKSSSVQLTHVWLHRAS